MVVSCIMNKTVLETESYEIIRTIPTQKSPPKGGGGLALPMNYSSAKYLMVRTIWEV